MQIRRAKDRGHANHGWLESHHTFSFADYYDPAQMGFRTLRVINEDRVQPGQGFGTHPHRDMEIITYVLEGALQHRDSMGNGSIIRPGDVQRMSAGTGVTHSEFNASRDDTVHFLQIWILPEQAGMPPSYEQRAFPLAERQGRLRLLASPGGSDGSVTVHQDVRLSAGVFAAGERGRIEVTPRRHAWLQIARGGIDIGAAALEAGDGAAINDAGSYDFTARTPAELLVFDLA